MSVQLGEAAHKIIISARPGQDVEITCGLRKTTGNIQNVGWTIGNIGSYGVSSLLNGILDGYSASVHTTSIIILNIMMNDSRNGTEYQCVTLDEDNKVIQPHPSDTILSFQLYVAAAGEYIYVLYILVTYI